MAQWLAKPRDAVNPLSAQELADEDLVQRKPRSMAQGQQDKQLVEDLLQRNARPSSPATPNLPTDAPST
jgi:hypothetical protein